MTRTLEKCVGVRRNHCQRQHLNCQLYQIVVYRYQVTELETSRQPCYAVVLYQK